jgi:hypothetical protein
LEAIASTSAPVWPWGAWVAISPSARHWRLEVGLVGDRAIEDPDTAEQILRKPERRLSDVLA